MPPPQGMVLGRAAVMGMDRGRWLSVRPVVCGKSVWARVGKWALIWIVAVCRVGNCGRSVGGHQRETVRLAVPEREQMAGGGTTVGGAGMMGVMVPNIDLSRACGVGMGQRHWTHTVGRSRQ